MLKKKFNHEKKVQNLLIFIQDDREHRAFSADLPVYLRTGTGMISYGIRQLHYYSRNSNYWYSLYHQECTAVHNRSTQLYGRAVKLREHRK